MFEEVLSVKIKKLLKILAKEKWLKNFYLAGGTALALHYGHRQSIDLDWFTVKPFNSRQLIKNLSAVADFKIINEDKGTLEGFLAGVKVSFLYYPYPLLDKKTKFADSVYLARPRDIALMKLSAIGSRNSKKDFIDLYFFLKKEQASLKDLFKLLPRKFKGVDYELYHFYKSLVYFAEADKEPMPRIMATFSWPKVKKFFLTEVKKITK